MLRWVTTTFQLMCEKKPSEELGLSPPLVSNQPLPRPLCYQWGSHGKPKLPPSTQKNEAFFPLPTQPNYMLTQAVYKLTSNITIYASWKQKKKKKSMMLTCLYHVSINQRKLGVAVLISNKVDLRTKKVTRHRKGYYIMIKSSIHRENVAILHICNK